jgi:hypothetical protein
MVIDWRNSNAYLTYIARFACSVYRRHMPSELESTFTALIGKRVSIRLHDPEGGFRDIVGYLQSPTTLRNRHEELIEFSHSEIFIWREVIAKK